MNQLKQTAINCTIAICAAFGSSATVAAEPATRLEQAAAVSPAAKIAQAMYAKPMNDKSLEDAKQELLKLPAAQLFEARRVYHDLADDDRKLARSVGLSITSGNGKHEISEIKSPEIREALTKFKDQGGSDHKAFKEVRKNIDEASKVREEAFKAVVNEAIQARQVIERKNAPGT